MTDLAYKAKRVLKEYRQLVKRISEKRERIRELYDSATRATPSLEAERVSGTGEHSRLETAMVRKIDIERQLRNSSENLDKKRAEIERAIDAMGDQREARLLELRYIDGRSWPRVMSMIELSESQSYAVHESALIHFAEIFF